MSVSCCKTATCDQEGCDARRVFVGYSEAQHATLLLREDGWWVEGDPKMSQGYIHNPGTLCPTHAPEAANA